MQNQTPQLALFAASKDQTRYFTELAKQLTMPVKVVHYKSLWNPMTWARIPLGPLRKQAELLVVRKQNSKKGRFYPQWVWPILTRFYMLHGYWIYGCYQRWLHSEQAEYIGVWNGKKFRQAILVAAIYQSGKKPIFFETGPLPGMSAIDPQGVNAYSSIPKEGEFYRQRAVAENLLTKPEPKKIAGLPDNYIFVPFQVVEDSNIYLHSDWVRNMRQLFSVFQSLAAELGAEYKFVFKPHPACNEDYSDLKAQQTDQLIFAEDIPTTDLVNQAQAIVTVNSTVGLEGLMAGKKVFVLGDALFAIEGVTHLTANKDALKAGLQSLDQLEFDEQLVNSFLDYLKNDYAIPENAMQQPGEKHWSAANKRLQAIVSGRGREALGLNTAEENA